MEWIRVEDRLPNEGEYVLCYLSYQKDTKLNMKATPLSSCCIEIVEYGAYGAGSFVMRSGFYLQYVSHWMPLPEAPK